jgi:AcrR family transcriptional regulator
MNDTMETQAPLNDLIIEKASHLFREQGYAATSIKQIANEAGCTNAALYYYYEGGKQEILREVIHHSAVEKMGFLSAVAGADSLESLLIQLSQTLSEVMPRMADRVNWLMLQFPTLPDEEKQFLRNQLFGFHEVLQAQIGRFVADDATADQLAWLIFCSFFGYQQVFTKMGVDQVVDMSLEDYGRFLAQVITTETE